MAIRELFWYMIWEEGMRGVFTCGLWSKVIVPGMVGGVFRDGCGDPTSRLRYGMTKIEAWPRKSPTALSLSALCHSLSFFSSWNNAIPDTRASSPAYLRLAPPAIHRSS